ncbi:ferritin-like domain-containing protein [Xanthobacter oligotrophicus]|uniref:Ferritin family protein n=1 Tax=Xanthobacter oligotrophicus TaxID=2607286 RepID=A0ABW6ZVQ2_9HYPH|nr:ferritin family protein [Xanthobacter oligotrophicus]MCG5235398.1 ferritin family protein [Xanthobacter oligotrophicus]
MDTVEEFLAYAVKLEEEAAIRFGELADVMLSCGNTDVAALFRRLSDYSRLHLADARARAKFRDIPDLKPAEFAWPDLESPETAGIWAADPFIGHGQALEIARDAEEASRQYYKTIFETTADPEIRALAKEFFEEESEHVQEIHKWIAAHAAGTRLPAE